ncbi:hypothetical protein D3C85_1178170 [compost metagenome]
MLQTSGFFLHPFFQHRVAFGEFSGHIIQGLAEHRHFIATADIRPLGEITLGHRTGHGQQLFPGVQQAGAEPDDSEGQQQRHKNRHHPMDHHHALNAHFGRGVERGDQRIDAGDKTGDVTGDCVGAIRLLQARFQPTVPVTL